MNGQDTAAVARSGPVGVTKGFAGTSAKHVVVSSFDSPGNRTMVVGARPSSR